VYKKILTLLLLSTSIVYSQTTNTPNIGLQLPAYGSTNWNLPLNYNFNLLDQLIGATLQSVGVGLSLKPVFATGSPTISCSATNQGQQFFNITTIPYVGYVCNNLSWVLVGSSGGGGSFPTNALVFGITANTSRAATVSDLITLLSGLSGCGTAGNVLSPAGSNCIPTSPFSIISFTGGSTVEIGQTVVNPNFVASYTTTPSSAAITNTDSISSPTNLTTPYTTGSVTGSFVHTTQTSTTFTLTAVGATTQTATTSISWLPRSFGGVGAAGATSSVTASGTTAVLSNSAVLANAGISSSGTGAYGPYSPSAQKIYIFTVGSSHTFTSSGFTFPFNSPTAVTFTNQYGSTVSMYLYESTNTVTGSYTISVN
jgi:hypothetical protein